MKIALFSGFDPAEKPHWNVAYGFRIDLQRRGHHVKIYPLPRSNPSRGFKECLNDINSGEFIPNVVWLSSAGYGVHGASVTDWNKNNFGKYLMVQECSDEPQQYEDRIALSNQSDLVFSTDLPCHFNYQKREIKSVWVTQWADTLIYYPDDTKKTKDCTTTTGSRLHIHDNMAAGDWGQHAKDNLVEWLQDNLGESFINVRFSGPLAGEKNASLFRESKIVFQFAKYNEVTRRIFEGAACGALVITNAINPNTGIYDIFEEDKDMIYYRSAWDCLEKIKYYLTHDKEREKIAYNAHKKVMTAHTLRHRVDTMLNKIEELV